MKKKFLNGKLFAMVMVVCILATSITVSLDVAAVPYDESTTHQEAAYSQVEQPTKAETATEEPAEPTEGPALATEEPTKPTIEEAPITTIEEPAEATTEEPATTYQQQAEEAEEETPLPMASFMPFQSHLYDLGNFITWVTVTDQNGVAIPDGAPLISGETVIFSIHFAENETLQFAYNSDGYLVFQLPPQITMLAGVDNVPINLAQHVIGHYNIDINGLVTAQFGNWYVIGEYPNIAVLPSDNNFIENVGNANFTITVAVRVDYTTETTEITFGLPESVHNFTVVPPVAATETTKTANWDIQNNRFIFTVDVVASGATVRNITMADSLSIAAFHGMAAEDMLLANPAASSAIGDISFQVLAGAEVIENGTIPSFTYNLSNVNGIDNVLEYFSHSFGGLELEPGQVLRVVYSVCIHTLIANNPHLETDANLTPNLGTTILNWGAIRSDGQPYSYNFNIINNVTISSNASDSTATANVFARRRLMPLRSKTVDPAATDIMEGYITWVASVGNGGFPLNGQEITDMLGPGQTLPANYESFIVRLYGLPNTVHIQYANTQNTVYSMGFSEADLLQPIGEVTAAHPALAGAFERLSDNSFAFTVPTDLGDIYRVTLIYTTTHSMVYDTPNDFANTVYFGGSGTEAIVRPEEPTFTVSRDGMFYIGGQWMVRHTTTLVVPAGHFNRSIWLNNVKSIDPRDAGLVGNPPNMVALTNPLPSNMTVHCAENNAAIPFSVFPDPNHPSTQWNLAIGSNNITNRRDARWPFSEPRTIVIVNYTLLNDLTTPGQPEETAETLLRKAANYSLRSQTALRIFSSGELDAHEITFWPPAGNSGHVLNTITHDYWPIFRTIEADPNDSALFHHEIMINTRNSFRGAGNLESFFFLNENGHPLFTDDFDPRKTLVPGSIFVERANNIGEIPAANRFVGPYGGSSAALRATPGRIELDLFNLTVLSWDGTEFDLATATVGAELTNVVGGAQPAHGFNQIIVRYSTRVIEPALLQDGTELQPHNGIIFASQGRQFNAAITPPPYNMYYLIKGMRQEANTARVNVEVTVNQHGHNITATDRFTVLDTMGENLLLLAGSIRLYTREQNQGGGWTAWAHRPTNPAYGELWSVNIIGPRQFEVILPDETPVKITYDAVAISDPRTPATIYNNVEIIGVELSVTREYIHNFQHAPPAQGSGSRVNMLLRKYDYETKDRLEGAEFELYVALLPNFIQPASTFVAQPLRSRDINGATFFATGAGGQTNAAGELVLSHQALYSGFNFLFMLVETAAPGGFMLPGEPYTFFVFAGGAVGSYQIAELEERLGTEIVTISDFISVYNWPEEEPAPSPTEDPTQHPTENPTEYPTEDPTLNPTPEPTPYPTPTPAPYPTPYNPTQTPPTAGQPGNNNPTPAVISPPPAVTIPAATETLPEPAPGNVMMQESNVWFEFDGDEVPLGGWAWNDYQEQWEFDYQLVPLAGFHGVLPQTGLSSNATRVAVAIGVSLILALATLMIIKRETFVKKYDV
ncbi:MAG: hypothetical protein FWC78_04730 [Defluviitaleaceae bacterium]|nr:hypothetical protein [Defluviitaleaceae bacterium]